MTSPVDISRARILEIGGSYFKREYPERTTFLWPSAKLPQEGEPIDGFSTPDRVLREINSGNYDVIVVNTLRYSPWHPRYWARAPFYTPTRPWASVSRAFGVSILRWVKTSVPLVAIDMDDAFGIGRSSVFLLDKAKVFFKRELPVDKWQVLYGSVHPHLPTLRYRNSDMWQRRMDVLQPISLPQFRHAESWRSAPFPKKTHDVFFSGAIGGNSTVRSAGLSELERLKARGYRIDQPKERLPFDAFLERMSRSWLAWSPEGLGWDCNRHYEAAIAQSVPVMNHPTIIRHAPLRDGLHGVYYDVEPGGLERTVVSALADREKLQRMATAARDHVFAHHVRRAYCERILKAALDRE